MIEKAHKKSLKRVRKLKKLLRSHTCSYQGLVVIASSPFIIEDNGSPYTGEIENIRLAYHYQVTPDDCVLEEELEYVENEIEECQYAERELKKFSLWTDYLFELVTAHLEQYDIDFADNLKKQGRLH